MRIRFSPPWEVQPNIDKVAGVKILELLQADFFNWLYDSSPAFSSIVVPETGKDVIYRSLMAPSHFPAKYYDAVNKRVMEGEKVSLHDLYGEAFSGRLRWCFKKRDDETVVTLIPTKSDKPGFTLDMDVAAKKMFCAELFKYMRSKTRVVDDSYSTSTQFANNEVLTQLYACHLLNKV